ncbi:serine/threonine protein kinase, CMGC, CDC2/CDK sub [Neophaeococcomyces mojaviensis]|uniref:Serine/threonine protein kinase, CMGC, CDC2/CDK sub n=1 Tax=Neophaeococcomyces mojaviensis TaxID=3383035 RepID=A0ACC2ZSQ6_9EURO|nr:serine/threonine protein kinase, CMGC, CDC2/CDK sub [Knufia sp. JES_112]
MATKPTPRGYPLEHTRDGKPRFRGCVKVAEYDYICKLGEGTFGEVSKARSKKTGQVVALKKILVHNEKDGFPITALREIKLLKALRHPNVLQLVEMAVERPKDVTKKSNMFMVTPYMDHDLSGMLKNPRIQFTEPQIKCYMKQLLEGCKYLHESKILHRDMKAANLLISNKGILQIADFGLARPYDDAPPQPGKGGGEATRSYTTLVVTRWYRPPELLLQLRNYTTAVDMWGVGCVFGEMFKRRPILQGDSDLAQAQLIFTLCGSPNDQSMPGWNTLPGCEEVTDWGDRRPTIRQTFKELSPTGLSLLEALLKLDWRTRINAIDALQHPYFHTHPLPARPEDLPVMEDSHEFDKQKQREERKPPPAPAGGQVGIGPQNEYGFQDRSRPYDRQSGRGGGRPPYANGQRRPPPHGQNGDYPDHRGPRPPRNNDSYDHAYRQPRHYDDPAYDRDRRPPPQYYDEPYSRRPPPDTSLPPRPPAPEVDPPYRDRDDRPPPRRIPPGAETGRPPADRQPAPIVDTYIPAYSSADPHARPPRNVLRSAIQGQPGDPTTRRAPLPPRDDAGRPISRGDYPPRRGSGEYDDVLSYDDQVNGDPYPRRGPSSVGSYERRRTRSRSPQRERIPDREREREYYGPGPRR